MSFVPFRRSGWASNAYVRLGKKHFGRRNKAILGVKGYDMYLSFSNIFSVVTVFNFKTWYFFLVLQAVTSESLVSREFSRFFLKFHFFISILSHFYFTFTSQSRFPVIFISLSFLEKSERDKNFALFLEKKRVKFYTIFYEKFNHSRIEGEEPKTKLCQE